MIWAIIAYTLLIVIYATRGVEQAIMYSKKGADAFKGNEHLPITIVRCAIVMLALNSVLLGNDTPLIIASFLPSFWFWHNTAYYWGRNKIDSNVYPDWFTARSTTSSSKTIKAMPFWIRLSLLILSISIFITVLIIKL